MVKSRSKQMSKEEDKTSPHLITRRCANIEFRHSNGNNRYELVEWHHRKTGAFLNYCITIASFQKSSEGYDMETVGERYQRSLEENHAVVIALTKYAFTVLRALFAIEEAEREDPIRFEEIRYVQPPWV